MNEIRELIDGLNRIASDLCSMQKTLLRPVPQGISIDDAFRKLRVALGKEAYINIGPPAFAWYGGSNNSIEVAKWTVYDGNVHHEGATLADAVNAALEAQKPVVPSDPIEQAAVVEEAFAEPLPM